MSNRMKPKSFSSFVSAAFVCLAFVSTASQALSLGTAELRAAQELGCVLADDALGYLDEAQFDQRFDEVVNGFDAEQTDVIYAQALGYIDGLLFGIDGAQTKIAEDRLRQYSDSDRCARVGASAAKYSISL
ncbi:MAG: hypothetical protein AAF680_13785 [Pseudomonadota bacterium]